MKTCSSCRETLDLSFFSKDKHHSDGLQTCCKECGKIKSKKWHNNPNNKQHRLEYARKARKEKRKWYNDIKSKMSCGICGENHIAVLDLHHRDPSQKDSSVSMILNKWGKKKILAEIEKCYILCSNCHRKFHYEQRRFSSTVEHSPVTGKVTRSALVSVANKDDSTGCAGEFYKLLGQISLHW